LKSGNVVTEQKNPNKFLKTINGERHFVVQFNAAVSAEDRKSLETQGAKILRYLPDDALVVRVDGAKIRSILAIASVRNVLPFATDWKMSDDFGPSSVFSAQRPTLVHVRLFPEVDEAKALSEIKALNLSVEAADGRFLTVKIMDREISKLAAVEAVEWIQPQPKFQTMNFDVDPEIAPPSGAGDYSDLNGYETGTRVMSFDAVWSRGLTGKGQIASFADTGLDNGDLATVHEDFRGHLPSGYFTGMFSESWEDPMGHGTHVAGSIAGAGVKSGGIVRGGAFDAQLIPVSMWSPMMDNIMPPTKLAELFNPPYTDGARIHSNSWGSGKNFGAYDSFAAQVDEYMAAHPDFLILFAAGNSGVDHNRDGRIDPNSIGSPGTAKNVLTVGASENLTTLGKQGRHKDMNNGSENWGVEPLASDTLSNNPDGLAVFSSRGPARDGRTKPEIVAPGTNILSNRSQHPDAVPLWGEYNKDYVWAGGTSMATPLTAGAATLVRQYLIENLKMAQPSAALVKAVLMHTAVDLYPGQYGMVGKDKGQEILTQRPNSDEGYGRVDVSRATDLATAQLVDEKVGLAKDEVKTLRMKVSAAGVMTATLVYTDAAAAPSAAQALVNDLDLVIVDIATGKEKILADRINNAEMLTVPVAAGEYEVRVKGQNVPQGPASGKQPYALVVTVR